MITVIIIILILFLLIYIAGQLHFFYFTVGLMVIIDVIAVLFFIFLIIEAYQIIFKGKVPYLPSSKSLIKKVISEINFKDKAIVYDLGSGDGKFLLNLTKNKNVKAIGYEKFILPLIISRINNLFSFKKCRFIYKDFYQADITDADYVFCYLFSSENKRLVEKLNKELKPGTIVVSNSFEIPGWQYKKAVTINSKKILDGKFYVYSKK